MNILFHGINYRPEPVGIAVYSADLAQALVQQGNRVDVITAKPFYPTWRVAVGYRRSGWMTSTEQGVRVIRCPLYAPRTPSGARRILHYVSFAASSFVPTLWKALSARPKLVFTVAPSLVAATVALLAARLVRAQSWLHVQDFEVEAAFATGFMSNAGRVAGWAQRFERWMLGRFDVVSSISPEMCTRLQAKGVAAEKVFELRNWADTGAVTPLTRASTYRATWSISATHVALYSGNIAQKQGIEIVVAAARLLAHRRDLLFVICGEGPNRQPLEAAAWGLDNVRIHDLQPREQLGELLGLATVHLLPQRPDAADLVLPSKLTNMLASARPVVATAHPGTGLYREVDGCGLLCPPDDARAFADAIERLIDDPSLCAHYAANGLAAAGERWSKERIVAKFCQHLTLQSARKRAVHAHP